MYARDTKGISVYSIDDIRVYRVDDSRMSVYRFDDPSARLVSEIENFQRTFISDKLAQERLRLTVALVMIMTTTYTIIELEISNMERKAAANVDSNWFVIHNDDEGSSCDTVRSRARERFVSMHWLVCLVDPPWDPPDCPLSNYPTCSVLLPLRSRQNRDTYHNSREAAHRRKHASWTTTRSKFQTHANIQIRNFVEGIGVCVQAAGSSSCIAFRQRLSHLNNNRIAGELEQRWVCERLDLYLLEHPAPPVNPRHADLGRIHSRTSKHRPTRPPAPYEFWKSWNQLGNRVFTDSRSPTRCKDLESMTSRIGISWRNERKEGSRSIISHQHGNRYHFALPLLFRSTVADPFRRLPITPSVRREEDPSIIVVAISDNSLETSTIVASSSYDPSNPSNTSDNSLETSTIVASSSYDPSNPSNTSTIVASATTYLLCSPRSTSTSSLRVSSLRRIGSRSGPAIPRFVDRTRRKHPSKRSNESSRYSNTTSVVKISSRWIKSLGIRLLLLLIGILRFHSKSLPFIPSLMTQVGTPESTGSGTPSASGIPNIITGIYNTAVGLASPTSTEDPNDTTDTMANGNDANATGDVLRQLVAELRQQGQPAQPAQTTTTTTAPLIAPRVGGLNSKGVWTGFGDPSNTAEPKSYDCYRDFIPGVGAREPFKTVSEIEARVKLGLSKHATGLLFSGPEEKDADQFVRCFRTMYQEIKEKGLDGIYIIILPSGKKVNFFESPGRLNLAMIVEWCQDLTTTG